MTSPYGDGTIDTAIEGEADMDYTDPTIYERTEPTIMCAGGVTIHSLGPIVKGGDECPSFLAHVRDWTPPRSRTPISGRIYYYLHPNRSEAWVEHISLHRADGTWDDPPEATRSAANRTLSTIIPILTAKFPTWVAAGGEAKREQEIESMRSKVVEVTEWIEEAEAAIAAAEAGDPYDYNGVMEQVRRIG